VQHVRWHLDHLGNPLGEVRIAARVLHKSVRAAPPRRPSPPLVI
jgi:hypothetical protein